MSRSSSAEQRTPHGGVVVDGADMRNKQEERGRSESAVDNPFDSTSTSSTFPEYPRPCALPPFARRLSATDESSMDADLQHDREQRHVRTAPQSSGSVSFTRSHAAEPSSSSDAEKASIARDDRQSTADAEKKGGKRSRTHGNLVDPEKAAHDESRSQHTVSTGYYDDSDDEDGNETKDRQLQEDSALRILLFMSGPCVVLSLFSGVWACMALLATIFSQPVTLYSKLDPFSQRLAGFLTPMLRLQLRCIYAPIPTHDPDDENAPISTCMLFIVHILSPLISFIGMFAFWTAAVYWLSSVVVGDPAGQDKRDDGKETVLCLRKWWEWWLLRCVPRRLS